MLAVQRRLNGEMIILTLFVKTAINSKSVEIKCLSSYTTSGASSSTSSSSSNVLACVFFPHPIMRIPVLMYIQISMHMIATSVSKYRSSTRTPVIIKTFTQEDSTFHRRQQKLPVQCPTVGWTMCLLSCLSNPYFFAETFAQQPTRRLQ